MGYARIENGIATHATLPPELVGLADESLADLSWVDPSLGFNGTAYLPITKNYLPHDPVFQVPGQQGSLVLDNGIATEAIPPIAKSVPLSVTPRQIREALIDTDLIDAVELAVSSGDRKLKNWWEFATNFERNHVHVIAMGAGLGVTPEQLDRLWILAESL